MSRTPVITIVGLGPGNPALRTPEASKCLDAASRIILRTSVHPGLQDLAADPRVETCDDLYENSSTFEEVYRGIAERVIARARLQDLVFAVPGHPTFGEQSVQLVTSWAEEAGFTTRFIAGISAIDAVAAAIGVDPLGEQVQCVDALELARLGEQEPYAGGRLTVDPYRPLLVSQVYADHVASAAKLWLTGLFPDDHPIIVVRRAAVEGEESVVECPLAEMDHLAVDHLTSVWIPALPPLSASRHWGTLVSIVARLRAPGGCPWDQEQTHATLRSAVLDEAYEVVDAIDANDADNLAEELGDLLLVIAMHAQIAEEAGRFSIGDALESVTTKLIRRHPHVFADVKADSAGEVLQNWQAIKARERAERGEAAKSPDPLERLPRSMPGLTKAARVLSGPSTPVPRLDAGPDPGERLLSVVAEIVGAGGDPEAVLHTALQRHVATARIAGGTDSSVRNEVIRSPS